MAKLQNVLNGKLARECYEELTIIDLKKLEIPFSGKLEKFQNPPDFMREYKENLLNLEVVNTTSNGVKLFIFV